MKSKAYETGRQGLYHPEQTQTFTDFADFPKFKPELAEFSVSNAWWMSNAAHLAYHSIENIEKQLNIIGYELLHHTNHSHTFCYIAANDQSAFVAFRGTQFRSKIDARTDLNFPFTHFQGSQYKAKVHRGFSNALDVVSNDIKPVLDKLSAHQIPVRYTGHSLGAALAVLCSAWIPATEVYTFGSPRIGNNRFCKHHVQDKIYRIVNCCDIVCLLPPHGLGFRHAGDSYFISPNNDIIYNIKKFNRFAIKSVAMLKYQLRFPLLRHDHITLRSLSDHSIINYNNSLWNAAAKEIK
ncbi:hypothetical protein MNBD_GAMMA12-821 [hydrothermal vent metagenome]|uniref:Fungal lipase-type domain-containing protein n=1 Tax=hydrothermal vent metagenome TaxID=652676 RepID=A0A3B0YV81_9ZZZZ